MRLSFFRKNWCTAWFFVVREVTAARQSGKASVIGLMLRSDTLLFYRMVQVNRESVGFVAANRKFPGKRSLRPVRLDYSTEGSGLFGRRCEAASLAALFFCW